MSRFHLLTVACGALALTAACDGPRGGTDVGNGATATVSLDVRGYDDLAGAKGVASAGELQIDEVWVSLDRVRLRPGTRCTGPDERIDVGGPLVAELMSGLVGGPVALDVELGTFCEFRAGFRRLDSESVPASAPPELIGASMFVRGHTASGTPFTVTSRQTEILRLTAIDGSFALGEDDDSLVLAFDLGRWLASIDFDDESEGKQKIVIDDTHDAKKLAEVERQARESARLYRDADSDHDLGPEERASGQELAR